MSAALILSLALVAGLAIGGLEWAWRIERRTARRETRQTWTVTGDGSGHALPPLDPTAYADDARTLDEPLSEYEQAAWREFERGES